MSPRPPSKCAANSTALAANTGIHSATINGAAAGNYTISMAADNTVTLTNGSGVTQTVTGVVNGRPAVMDRADEGEPVGHLRVQREDFGDLDRRGSRGDRLKRAADLGRGLGLHIERVDVAWRAEVEDHDAGAVVVRLRRSRRLGRVELRQ